MNHSLRIGALALAFASATASASETAPSVVALAPHAKERLAAAKQTPRTANAAPVEFVMSASRRPDGAVELRCDAHPHQPIVGRENSSRRGQQAE